MIKYLLLILCISNFGTIMALIPEELSRGQGVIKECMSAELIESARALSKGDIQKATTFMIKEYNRRGEEINKGKKEYIKFLLTDLYKNLFEHLNPKTNKLLDPNYPVEDYIFEECLGHFWINW